MPIDLNDLKKLELSSTGAAEQYDPDDMVTAILKVKKRNYVPKNVKLRARIDEEMCTVEFRAGDLKKLEDDANVASVAVSKRLQKID